MRGDNVSVYFLNISALKTFGEASGMSLVTQTAIIMLERSRQVTINRAHYCKGFCKKISSVV